MARRVVVFFYGLFMDVHLLRSKGVAPEGVRLASAPGFALRIGQRATLIADSRSVAHGLVMQLSHEDIDKLYSEPSVAAYRPEAIVARSEGVSIPALCFNLVVPPKPEDLNPEYAARLRDLARQLGLPPAYVEEIR